MSAYLPPGHAPLKFHPLANLFPMLSDSELDDLAEDIRANGQVETVKLHRGMVLDGRNRYTACGKKNLGVRTEVFQGSDREALNWVISKNLKRRHLTESQRAMVAAKLATLRLGDNQHTAQLAPIGAPSFFQDAPRTEAPAAIVSQPEAADMMNVGRRSVQRAAVVQERGTQELQDEVEAGNLAVSTAAEIAERPAADQKALLDALPRDEAGKLTPDAKKEIRKVAKEVRAEDQAEKKKKRDDKEKKFGDTIKARGKFGVVLEDFEWDHEPYSRETGMDRHPSNHYPTAAKAHTPEDIVAVTAERFECADEKCVLYMWTTIPHCSIAMEVIRLRGFEYKSQRCWDKVRAGDGRGTGYWVTGEHELLLIATRGGVVAPVSAHFPSRFEAPVGKHSEKPDQQYEHAEYHFPNTPKIELNARRSRTGWIQWGNEAPAPEQPRLELEREGEAA
jgi:N6-adenosine-specific RNA methylase IME4